MKTGSKKKTISIFINLLLVCLSISTLLLVELYLRFTDYGYVDRLFTLNKETNQYVLNKQLYQKYFPVDPLVKKSRLPLLFHDKKFNAEKSESVFRIFCLGGSTTEGDLSNANFPDLLQETLSRSEVGKKIEVINLGFTTLNSYQVADFVAEIVDYDPDLFVLYTGHNEIYGPLGVASGSQISSSYWLTTTVLYLQKFRLFQLLQNFYLKFLEIDTDEDRTKALFRVMAKSEVPPHSPLREKALQYFSFNLDKIIKQTKKNNIPLIMSTVDSNIRDFRPFDSAVPTGDIAPKWESLINSAQSLADRSRYSDAKNKFQEAINLFPDNAQQYYDLGQIYLKFMEYDLAEEALIKAKDLDIIPFRAPSGINKIIRDKAAEANIDLLDIEEIYERNSRAGIVGKPIIVEHLHPSAYGHYLIAVGLTNIIFETGLLKPEKEIDFTAPEVRESFKVKINSEKFDKSSMWPFHINNKEYRFP